MNTHIAVCGAGAFGSNHIRIYRELAAGGSPVHLAAIVDPDEKRARAAVQAVPPAAKSASSSSARQGSTFREPPPAVFPSIEALLDAIARGQLRIDAASVCTPTSAHHGTAAQLLAAGIHVLVEKPITSTLAEADSLLALAAQHGRILQVGHLERFNPAVRALAPLLRGPMFFEAHRLSVFSPRSLDVDVVLDLMIHDLDIVLYLTQSPVAHVQAVGLPILSLKTDIANVRVEFQSGAVANFTASRVSTERVRKLRFFQPHQYLSVDYARQDLLVIEVQPPSAGTDASQLDAAAPAMATSEPTLAESAAALPSLAMHKPPVTPGEPLRLEIEAFLEAVRTGAQPPVTAQQAREALALALRIQRSIETHAQHAGLHAFGGS